MLTSLKSILNKIYTCRCEETSKETTKVCCWLIAHAWLVLQKRNIESMVYINEIKSLLRILIFKKSKEKLTFSVSDIYYFRNSTFSDFSLSFHNDPLFLLTTPFYPNFLIHPLLAVFGRVDPTYIKGGGVHTMESQYFKDTGHNQWFNQKGLHHFQPAKHQLNDEFIFELR